MYVLTAYSLLHRAQFHGRSVGRETNLVQVGQRRHEFDHFRVIPVRRLQLMAANRKKVVVTT